ncbi:twin-arginine translocase subunit TatC [Sphingomicrobium sediminis]|uniref:Sec-independent protein translocase protein TatC n=1 Tax=Sphingomicrobium sediminis TaxID=2950949 RepID=A0A9X2J4T1_9SPHN|nr:twin-arginine translocase subunit TatC [Sphingomicrobium sediminis]MCM8557547.1 twin-arginine translocase subunit TatC [Sphingomicrobium sediminis]
MPLSDIDDTKMPLLDHLIELRKRLVLVVAVLAVAFFACFYLAKPIFSVLVQPLLEAGEGRLIFTDVFEAFFVEVKVALFAALMITFPVLATQLWRFVAPGLYAKEKKAFLPFLILTPFFFAGGASFAYFVAMPIALDFLLGFEGEVGGVETEAMPAIGNYLSFSTKFLFGFGLAFLLPILVMLLERAGLVTREQLAAGRRYMIVAAFAIAAVLTPPDAVSQIILAVPLVLLYEFAILAIRFTHWRSAKEGAKDADATTEASVEEAQTVSTEAGDNLGPETPPGGGRVGGSGPT